METQPSAPTEQNEQLLSSTADGIELQPVDGLANETLNIKQDDTAAKAQNSQKSHPCGMRRNIAISRCAHMHTHAYTQGHFRICRRQIHGTTSAFVSGYIEGDVSKVQSWSITLVYFAVYFTMGLVIAAPG